MDFKTKKAIADLYKKYNKVDTKESWIFTEMIYPDIDLTAEQLRALTPEEEKHRKIGALTAITKLSDMLSK